MEIYDDFSDLIEKEEKEEKEEKKDSNKKKKKNKKNDSSSSEDESSSEEESSEYREKRKKKNDKKKKKEESSSEDEEESEETEEEEEESESDSEEKKRKSKKNITKEFVLDKDNEKSQFLQFLKEKKGKEGDFSNYLVDDLKILIKVCIKEKKKDKKETPTPKSNKEGKEIEQIKIKENQNDGDFDKDFEIIENNIEINQEKQKRKDSILSNIFKSKKNYTNIIEIDKNFGVNIEDTKQCETIEKTALSKYENIQVVISDPKVEKAGIISKGYMSYLISTFPLESNVRRRYSDFVLLYECLKKLFPSNIIPSIPKARKLGQEKYGRQFIVKRARKLEKFLNYLVRDPLIKNSQILYEFLSMKSKAELKKLEKSYKTISKINDVKEFKSINGIENISITKEKEEYFKQIIDNTEINVKLFKQLKTKYKLLYKNTCNILLSMRDITKIWDNLSLISNKYYDNYKEIENYKLISRLFKIIIDEMKDNGQIISINLREHFKYIQKNYISLKSLTKTVISYKNNYEKIVNSLINKKEEQFKKSENYKLGMDKQKAMKELCPLETINAIRSKEFYGYFLNRCINEYERMSDLIGILNKEILMENVNKLLKTPTKFLTSITEIISGLDANNANK